MIHDPTLHHRFVLLFEIKNASPASLSNLSSPHQLTRDVRYGLVLEDDFQRVLSLHLERKMALPVLQRRSARALSYSQGKPKALIQYFNIRMFGFTDSAGRVVIPCSVRFSMARSIDPIFPLSSGCNAAYGLYRMHGYYDPRIGTQNGVERTDLELIWQGITSIFKSDSQRWPVSSAMRGLWIFSHENSTNSVIPPRELFNLVQTPALKRQARKFEDYTIQYPSQGRLETMPDVYLTHFT